MRARTRLLTTVLAMSCVMALTASALATPATADISSAGPLNHVWVGADLSCQIAHVDDEDAYEMFPPGAVPGDCGTFLAVNGVLYAPDFDDHDGTATGSLGEYIPFRGTQSPVTGTGTAENPYKVVTTVTVGNTGLRIVETDSYVPGEQRYRTDVQITNTAATARSAILYRAGDCYLGGSDDGFGMREADGSVGCSINANNSPPGRFEKWTPLTEGSRYYESFYATVWDAIGSQQPFADTCDCDLGQDNGAGLSWNVSLAPGASRTYSHYTTFETGCGEDGIDRLAGTPASGVASGTVHRIAEPLAPSSLGSTVHSVNCGLVVPAENMVDDLLG